MSHAKSWNQLVKQNLNYALGDDDILAICDGKVKIISYEDLHDYQTIDQLMEPYGAVIILYQATKQIGHWVAVLKHKNKTIEVFGSYGLKIDEQLQFSTYNMQLHGGKAQPHLTNLIDASGYKKIYNHTQLQSYNNQIATCGRYASLRVRFRDMPLDSFVKLFTGASGLSNDQWATALTLLFS
jgi:hypothetical protein